MWLVNSGAQEFTCLSVRLSAYCMQTAAFCAEAIAARTGTGMVSSSSAFHPQS